MRIRERERNWQLTSHVIYENKRAINRNDIVFRPVCVWEGGDEKLFIHSKSCETFPENRKLPSGSNSLVFQLNLGLLPDLSSG